METAAQKKERIRRQNEKAHKRRLNEELTKRDIEIIKLIYQEKTTQEIAEKLGKSKRTIDSYRLYIIKKIGCKNAVGIIKYAIANGLVPAPVKKRRR